jgi:maltose alpha-D-glucosyltransferase/alpha-amylase
LSALEVLERQAADIEPSCRPLADEILAARDSLVEAAERLARGGAGTSLSRIHGDFHLGQILIAQGDAYIIDFEGEPASTVEGRRAKASPVRDVAGFLRSLDYAAASLPGPADDGSPQPGRERRRALLDDFRRLTRSAFLEAYWAAVEGAAGESQASSRGDDALIELFTLQKAAYEICYEAANRPKWLSVPLRGMAMFARSLAGEA